MNTEIPLNVASTESGTLDTGTTRMVDANPFLARSSESVYELLETQRTALRQTLETALAARNIRGVVLESSPRAAECWVTVVCWMPQSPSQEIAARRTVLVRLIAHEQHRFPVEHQVELSGAGRERKITCIHSLTEQDIGRLIDFLTRPRVRIGKRHFKRFRPKAGTIGERILLPRNRPTGLVRRWLAKWRQLWLAILLLGVALSVWLAGPESIIGLALVVTSLAIRLRYPVLFEKRGVRPLGEPRSLLRYDSWQTVVPDVGNGAPDLRATVMSDLKQGQHKDARIETERVWHWGMDSVVEREQIVLHFRRSIIFIEIHAYGADLYVDWEAYLNFGVWAEKPAAVGFEPNGSVPVIVHEVEAGLQALGEYDLSDANFALEWVHAVIKRHLRRVLAERKIDEDIDFRIIREDRTSIREAKPADAARKSKGRFRVVGEK